MRPSYKFAVLFWGIHCLGPLDRKLSGFGYGCRCSRVARIILQAFEFKVLVRAGYGLGFSVKGLGSGGCEIVYSGV